MPRGPCGRRSSGVRGLGLVCLVAVGAAACGEAAPTAEGADLDRPATASMATVRFTDVADDVGLAFRHSAFRWGPGPDPVAMMGGGLCWIDHDRDGWLDLYVVDTWSDGEWGRWRAAGEVPRSRLYRNDAGRFEDVTDDTNVGVENRGNGCVAADLDGDGWTDLYVTTERENVLLWNDAGAGFVRDDELPEPSGAGAYGWHAAAAVGDVDGNGWPDLFVSGYTDLNHPNRSTTRPGFPNPFVGERDLLLLNEGPSGAARVRFRDVAAEVGIEPDGPEYGLGAVLSDLDADGDLDLYVANDTTPNQLYEHVPADAPPGFGLVERGAGSVIADEGAGMGVAAADMDGDGSADLVTTNQLDERHVLASGIAGEGLRFRDARAAAGVPDLGQGQTGWGTSWADVDLDGDRDLVVVNGAIPVTDLDADRQHVVLYENRPSGGSTGSGGLVDRSGDVGLDRVGPLLGRGLAAADYDNDGDLDLAIGTIGGQLALLRNSGAGGNWLTVATPAPLPGAVVTVHLPDGSTQQRELVAGSSYLSSEDPRAHFGLGEHERVDAVEIRVPDGRTIRLTDVEAGQVLELDPDDVR